MIKSKSHGKPFKWTAIIAFTFLLYAFLIPEILKFPLLSTSAKIGFNPKFNTQLADATNDLGVTITESVFLKFKAFKAISKATLPFETASNVLCCDNQKILFQIFYTHYLSNNWLFLM